MAICEAFSAALASLSSTATRFEDSPPSEVQNTAGPSSRQAQLITPETIQAPLHLSATPHQGSNGSEKGGRPEATASYIKSLRARLNSNETPLTCSKRSVAKPIDVS